MGINQVGLCSGGGQPADLQGPAEVTRDPPSCVPQPSATPWRSVPLVALLAALIPPSATQRPCAIPPSKAFCPRGQRGSTTTSLTLPVLRSGAKDKVGRAGRRQHISLARLRRCCRVRPSSTSVRAFRWLARRFVELRLPSLPVIRHDGLRAGMNRSASACACACVPHPLAGAQLPPTPTRTWRA